MITSNVWHCFCILIARKNTEVLVTFQHDHVTQRLVAHNSVGNKTKGRPIRPRLRPRPKLRGRSETSLVIRPRSQTPRLVQRREHSLFATDRNDELAEQLLDMQVFDCVGRPLDVNRDGHKSVKEYHFHNMEALVFTQRSHGGSGLQALGDHVQLTKERCCVTLDDDKEEWRAKLACGHVVSTWIHCDDFR